MLEYRNKVWPYDYMAFARRIGELWEPFCKLPFEYPVKTLKIIEPPDFDKVQAGIKKQTKDYISKLDITEEERRILIEEKETYNHLGGNSYVDDMFDRLKKEGKL